MNESEIISDFLKPKNKERVKVLLSSERGRQKFILTTLAHNFIDKVDPKFIQANIGTEADIVTIVVNCFNKMNFGIISEYVEFEKMKFDLKDVLKQIIGFGMGTIIYSIDGSIMYYEGEESNERYIISKNSIQLKN
jgi:hypothetical protein